MLTIFSLFISNAWFTSVNVFLTAGEGFRIKQLIINKTIIHKVHIKNWMHSNFGPSGAVFWTTSVANIVTDSG